MGTLRGTLDGDFERNFKMYSEWDPEGKFKGGLLLIFFGGLWALWALWALWRGIQGGLWLIILMGLWRGIYRGLWWGILNGIWGGLWRGIQWGLWWGSLQIAIYIQYLLWMWPSDWLKYISNCWFLLNTVSHKKIRLPCLGTLKKTLGLMTQLLIGLPTSAAH